MDMIKVVRSFVDAEALAKIIATEYDFGGQVTCRLFSKMLRTQDNDHYLVTTGSGDKFVARVYQVGTRLERQEADYLYELDWLNFLEKEGLSVSYPIARQDGGFLGSVNAPEGLRYYTLFSFALGSPMSMDDEEHLYIVGREMARIHQISNKFENQHERQPLDLEFLVDKPVARLKRYWDEDAGHKDDLELLLISALEAKDQMLELINNDEYTPDGWGPIGGDFHNGSVFFDGNNPTFFNFDWCGVGWRAYDIAAFLHNTDLIHQRSPELVEAFFAGYYAERPLTENEHESIAPFLTIRRIWLTGLFTMNDGLAGHSFIAPM
ncbi:MAG: phosphotransferase [Chloroflexi bacterium]|nr:phosphotransferase [Chloroflexota bacterium]